MGFGTIGEKMLGRWGETLFAGRNLNGRYRGATARYNQPKVYFFWTEGSKTVVFGRR